jgi:molybdenum cofactor sulfurtransferase
LILRNDASSILNKRYFGGGTVDASIADEAYHVPRRDITRRMEDGTIDFLSISSLAIGFTQLHTLTMSAISRHVHTLVHHPSLHLSISSYQSMPFSSH